MKKITALFLLVLLSGCSSTAPTSPKVALSSLNFHPHEYSPLKSQIVIFNSSSELLPYQSGAMNVEVDGKGIGQLATGEYIIIELEKGDYEFTLIQQDVFSYESVHAFTARYETHFIDVNAKLFENRFETTHSLPSGYQSVYE